MIFDLGGSGALSGIRAWFTSSSSSTYSSPSSLFVFRLIQVTISNYSFTLMFLTLFKAPFDYLHLSSSFFRVYI